MRSCAPTTFQFLGPPGSGFSLSRITPDFNLTLYENGIIIQGKHNVQFVYIKDWKKYCDQAYSCPRDGRLGHTDVPARETDPIDITALWYRGL